MQTLSQLKSDNQRLRDENQALVAVISGGIFVWCHKYTNTQIHKYTNTQIYKYTNAQIQIHKYRQTQVASLQDDDADDHDEDADDDILAGHPYDNDDYDHDNNADEDILAGHPYGCIRLKTRILPKLRFGRRYKFYYNPKWLYS